jgi:hypothetical protein
MEDGCKVVLLDIKTLLHIYILNLSLLKTEFICVCMLYVLLLLLNGKICINYEIYV